MQDDVRTLRVIWGALLLSTVIYVILASVLVQGSDNNLDRGLFYSPVPLMLYGLGLVMFGLSFFLPKLFMNQGVRSNPGQASIPSREGPSRIRQALIVRYALLESCAIFGLVAAFLSQEWQLILPLWVVSAAGFLMAYPSENLLARMREE